MEIRVLRYFLAVAREENITRAAESLHIAQPSLSKQLIELEQELGKQLLIRGKRKITLTEEGILLRKRAEEIISLTDKTCQEISSDSSNISGEVSIGGFLPPVVFKSAAELRKKYPEIRFSFFSDDAADITERLDHGSLDFAILLQPVDTLKYEFLPLPATSRWGLLMTADNPLASCSAITRDQIKTIPLILHRRRGLQIEFSHWAQAEISELNVAATYNIAQGSLSKYVTSGLGSFLTAEDHLPPDLQRSVCFRPLDPPLLLHYALSWKRHAVLGRAAECFLRELQKLKPESWWDAENR